jgi:hypothetical protein
MDNPIKYSYTPTTPLLFDRFEQSFTTRQKIKNFLRPAKQFIKWLIRR